jgi:hypothetical protein
MEKKHALDEDTKDLDWEAVADMKMRLEGRGYCTVHANASRDALLTWRRLSASQKSRKPRKTSVLLLSCTSKFLEFML